MLLHYVYLFGVNECKLNLIRDALIREQYYDILYFAATSELKDILGDQFDLDNDYFSILRSLHLQVRNEL